MATQNITYTDKEQGQVNSNPVEQTFTFEDANEIKDVVNNNATEINTKIAKNVGATYTTNEITTVTQAEYDALTPVATTLYFIV